MVACPKRGHKSKMLQKKNCCMVNRKDTVLGQGQTVTLPLLNIRSAPLAKVPLCPVNRVLPIDLDMIVVITDIFFYVFFQIVNGYFVHFFAPKNISHLPKNIVFIIDVSISMSGRKLSQVTQNSKVNQPCVSTEDNSRFRAVFSQKSLQRVVDSSVE